MTRFPIPGLAVVLFGVALLSTGCISGYEYSKADLKHDAFELVPPGGSVEEFDVRSVDMLDGGEFTADHYRSAGRIRILSPGHRSPATRLATYLAIAQTHGWTCSRRGCHKPHVQMAIRIGVALPQTTDAKYDEISLLGSPHDYS